MPRLKRPHVAKLNEVRITKEKEAAIIEFLEPGISTTHLTIGPEIIRMNDQEILDIFNGVISAQEWSIATYEHIAVEIPAGKPQLKYSARSDQWTPRGDVLRCFISDEGRDAIIEIDGREFSMVEFGRILATYAGWGMRICFVPEDDINLEPKIEIREPE
jgi:hypothetical protein